MKALVTGGTGLLGSHIAAALVEQGHEVRALARRTSDARYLESIGAGIVWGDVEDYETLPQAVAGADIVFHAASRVALGWGEWEDFERTNVKGTEDLLKTSAEAGVSRFLHVSTTCVYSRLPGPATPLVETSPREASCTPDTYYHFSKLKAEEAVFGCQEQGKLNVTIIRPETIYGPRDRYGTDRMYSHVSKRIVLWPGKSSPLRAPVYASDVAELAILAATSDQAIGQAYNVAPPQPVPYREMARHMIRAQGGKRVHINLPFRLMLLAAAMMEGWARLRRSKEMPFLTPAGLRSFSEDHLIDGSKARTDLGWEQEVSLEEGTRRYVEWRLSQKKT